MTFLIWVMSVVCEMKISALSKRTYEVCLTCWRCAREGRGSYTVIPTFACTLVEACVSSSTTFETYSSAMANFA